MDIYEQWLKVPKKPKDLEKVISEAGLCTVVRCWFYHQDSIVEKIAQMFCNYGDFNPLDMLTIHLRRHMQSNRDYVSILHDVQDTLIST